MLLNYTVKEGMLPQAEQIPCCVLCIHFHIAIDDLGELINY